MVIFFCLHDGFPGRAIQCAIVDKANGNGTRWYPQFVKSGRKSVGAFIVDNVLSFNHLFNLSFDAKDIDIEVGLVQSVLHPITSLTNT